MKLAVHLVGRRPDLNLLEGYTTRGFLAAHTRRSAGPVRQGVPNVHFGNPQTA